MNIEKYLMLNNYLLSLFRVSHFRDLYIIRSKKDSRLYTGSTGNLRKRLKDHNEGRVHSTKGRGSFELIYYETCINEEDARAREKYLKSGMGKGYINNRLRRLISLTGLMEG